MNRGEKNREETAVSRKRGQRTLREGLTSVACSFALFNLKTLTVRNASLSPEGKEKSDNKCGKETSQNLRVAWPKISDLRYKWPVCM